MKTRMIIAAAAVLGASIASALPAVAAPSDTMPNVAGQNLWAALQQLPPLGDVTTVDVTGTHRYALLPTIWKVCDQIPAPGTELTPDTPITLGVVKTEEVCP